MTLLETMSSILGMPIREGKWRQYLTMLDRDGKIDKKTQLEMILALCEKISEIEKELGRPISTTVSVKDLYIPLEETVAPQTALETLDTPLTPEALKLKRQENMKKAQEARRKKYELKRAATK